jgi:adenylate cyclase
MGIEVTEDYRSLLVAVKHRIRAAQYEALKAVNRDLMALYWNIGELIVTRQESAGWGKSVVEQLAQNLQIEFHGMAGFSARHIWNMRNFYVAYSRVSKPLDSV